MIANFFNVLKKDIQDIPTLRPSFNGVSKDNEKVALIATRAFNCLGMAFGASLVLSSIVSMALNPPLGIAQMILGVSIFMINHDVFLLSAHRTNHIDHPIKNVAQTIFSGFRNYGSKAPHLEEATQKTFLKPLWQEVLSLNKIHNYFFSIHVR